MLRPLALRTVLQSVGRRPQSIAAVVLSAVLPSDWAAWLPLQNTRSAFRQPTDEPLGYALQSLEEIQQLIAKGDLAKVRAQSAEALKISPNDPNALNLIGVIDAQEGKYRAAETDFQKAIGATPRPGSKMRTQLLRALLVIVTLASGALAQEVRLQDIPSTGLGPSNFQDLPIEPADRAAVEQAFKSRQYERAESLLVEQINKNPRSSLMLTTLAGILFLDGRYFQCAVALKKAEALSPLDNRNRFTLALAYIILNHRDWARPELEKLVSADPLNPLYPYWLGRIDYDAMRFKEAVTCFRKALGLDPHFMKGYDNLGLSYEALAQYDDAIRAYEDGTRLNRERPDPSPWPDLNLATLLIKLGKFEDARKALDASLGYDHNFPKAHYQMGLLLEKEKKDKEAIEELNLAVRYDPSYPEPHYVLGRIYQRLGDKAKANAAWSTFQKLKKENPDVRPH